MVSCNTLRIYIFLEIQENDLACVCSLSMIIAVHSVVILSLTDS